MLFVQEETKSAEDGDDLSFDETNKFETKVDVISDLVSLFYFRLLMILES